MSIALLRDTNPKTFFSGGTLHFLYKYQHHSHNQPYSHVQEQDRIDKRSNPTSPPSYATINNMDCCVGWLLFGNL